MKPSKKPVNKGDSCVLEPQKAEEVVVAQLVERLVRNEKVAGSSPVGSTIPKAPQGRFIPPPLSFTRQIQLIFAVLSLLQSVPAS